MDLITTSPNVELSPMEAEERHHIIAGLFTCFPSTRMGADEARGVLDAYTAMTARYPLEILAAATYALAWRGKAFAPSAGDVVQACIRAVDLADTLTRKPDKFVWTDQRKLQFVAGEYGSRSASSIGSGSRTEAERREDVSTYGRGY